MTNPSRSSWRILVGVDGSESALAAVRWATAEAHRRKVGLRLVEALDSQSAELATRWAVDTGLLERLRQSARDRVAAGATVAAEIAPEVSVTAEVVPAIRSSACAPRPSGRSSRARASRNWRVLRSGARIDGRGPGRARRLSGCCGSGVRTVRLGRSGGCWRRRFTDERSCARVRLRRGGPAGGAADRCTRVAGSCAGSLVRPDDRLGRHRGR